MMLNILVLALAFSVTAGQAQVPSCVKNAAIGADGRCQCNAGFGGNPQICCYPTASDKGCYVLGDPTLTSFTGQKIGLDFPCSTRLSSTQSTNGCRVDVYSYEQEFVNGAIFTAKVKVDLVGNGKVSMMFTAGNVVIDGYTISSFDQDMVVAANGRIPNDGLITFDPALRLYTLTACGTTISVRPQLGNQIESPEGAPGVCIVTSSQASGSQGMCNLNQDVSSMSPSQYLDQALLPLNAFINASPAVKAALTSPYSELCENFLTYLGRCQSQDAQNALKTCAHLLFNSVTRRCYYESQRGAPPKGRNLRPFLMCVDAYCQGTRILCDGLRNNPTVKACDLKLQQCETWEPFRRLNSFVAGEGAATTQAPVQLGEQQQTGGEQTTEFNPALALGGILGGESGGNEGGNPAGGVDTNFNPEDIFG